MMIIVEGVDRVGKSTLCKRLNEELNMPVFHDKFKPAYVYKAFVQDEYTATPIVLLQVQMKFAMMLQWGKLIGNVIIDRCHFTEYVYNYCRGIYDNDVGVIDKKFSEIEDVYLILVTSSDLKKSSEEHGADLSMHERLFRGLYHGTKIKHKFLITYADIEMMVQIIKNEKAEIDIRRAMK